MQATPIRFIISAAAALAVATGAASAATYVVVGGKTDVGLDTAALASLGWNISGVGAENLPPDEGFATAFPILGSSTFTFSDEGGFAYIGGLIAHSGSVSLSNAAEPPVTLTVGEFDIALNNGGFGVRDTLLTDAFLFDVDLDDATVLVTVGGLSITGGVLRATSALSQAIAGNDSLAGAAVGSAQITALTIPEPSTALMGGMLALLGLRRRR